MRDPITADADKRSRLAEAMRRVSEVMNDRAGYEVDGLDAETREDMLRAIVEAAQL